MRILHCMNALNSCLHVKGDVIECGVASGANTFPLSDMVKTHNKKTGERKRVFACDTFSGLPYDDSEKSAISHKRGEFNYGLNFKMIQSQRNDLPIVRVEGLVEETLTTMLSHGEFCFAFLDMDLYQPTKYALLFLKDRIQHNGIIGFHDYDNPQCTGIRKAIEESLDMTKFEHEFLKDNTIFFRKTRI